MSHAYAAVDVGVESGRVVVGRLVGDRLSLHVVHRFANRTQRVDGTLRWDIDRVYGEILAGLGAARRAHPGLTSAGIEAWGMDFGLLDARGRLLGAPFHHGDPRTEGIPARLYARVPEEEIWAATGAQSAASSTLCQLFAMVRRRSSTLHRAVHLLMVPDLLSYWLSGVQVTEHTIATTTQCYDVETGAWIAPLLERAGIPAHIFPPVVPPATRLGPVQGAPARRAGLGGLGVVAPAAHDTASAVAAIPAERSSFAFIRSGPSSQVGAVVAAPVKVEAARRLGFTNEGGVDGTVCLHRTVAGLGLAQEDLVWSYRRAVRDLEAVLGRRLEIVHVVGEGARDALLCQLTADACGRPVLAGPVEAAALGNVLAQAVAAGACASWSEARALARASVAVVRYEPKDAAAWDEAAARLVPALEADRPRPE